MPSAPYDEYTYENEVEPEYTASDEGNSEGFSQSGSDIDETRSVPDADGSDQDAITADTAAAATEAAARPTIDETGENTRDKEDEKIGDESTFIDNMIDNAKGKVDNCVIA